MYKYNNDKEEEEEGSNKQIADVTHLGYQLFSDAGR